MSRFPVRTALTVGAILAIGLGCQDGVLMPPGQDGGSVGSGSDTTAGPSPDGEASAEDGTTQTADGNGGGVDSWTPTDDVEPAGDTGGGGRPDVSLSCDKGFSFDPTRPETSKTITVDYTHPSKGYAYIGLRVTGPGSVQDGGLKVVQDTAPYLWRFWRAVDAGGVYTFTFTSDGKDIASCEKYVRDTGAPPNLDGGGGGQNCTCGSGNGCETCPIVGSCFDSPSKYHPDPNKSGWQCLDTAGCSGGNCKIWCPFEPCEKSGGCSNNTETCYVPPGITDYEEACRRCCESAPRNAIWNAKENFCAEPGQ